MNFDRSLIFAYLEEDNIQRAYFRVRPLLSLDGDIRQEAEQLWPNEGGLRIVPDRNEQHTFKARMRNLGSYCAIDLRNLPAEAGKIRTNKNFKPERGEVNQFIIYSDTIHALPENTFYELIEGAVEAYAKLAEQAVTPLFYIRQDDTVYGPIRKDAPVRPETAQEMAGVLFTIPCPDQTTHTLLCVEDAVQAEVPEDVSDDKQDETPVQAEATEPPSPESKQETSAEKYQAPDALPIGETLQILDVSKNHEETLEQLNKPVSQDANLLHQAKKESIMPVRKKANEDPLAGTPLVRTPLRVAPPQTKNRFQEVVTNQWSIGKYEPPAQNLPNGTPMRAIENPVEAACISLKDAWNANHSHNQLLDFMLGLNGLRAQMEERLCDGKCDSVMQKVLRQRLLDLEAERLMALCELDRARRDTDAYKQELLNAMASRIAKETEKLSADREQAETQVNSLKTEVNALTLQRDALLAKVNEIQSAILPEAVAKLTADAFMAAPMAGIPLRMSPVAGQFAEPDELIELLVETCAASDVEIDRNTAIAVLVMLAISPRIGIACPAQAALATLLKNIAVAFGWEPAYAHQYAAEQHPLFGAAPVDACPTVLATSLPNYAPLSRATKLTLNRNASNLVRNAAYDVSQWPILSIQTLPLIPEITKPAERIVCAASIAQFAEKTFASDDELDAVLNPILRAANPLSGTAKKEMYRFISVCAGLMEGGLPVAADWGILLWIVPALERGSKHHTAVRALLNEYPLSLNKM